MPQLSLEERVTLARQFKTLNPNLTDAELGDIINDAQSVDNDPVKSQALLQKILPKQQTQVQTQLPSSYEGAGYTQADLMKQYNPADIQRAYAEQQRNYQASLPSRMIGGILAGGSGSSDVMTKNKADWEAIDKQNMLQSIERQKALREGATAGLEAAGKVQAQAKTAGEYTGSQMKTQEEINQARQKTELGQFGVEAARRMNDPKSPETQLAKVMLIDQFKAAGLPLPKGIDGATAQQLMGFMDPKVLDAYKTKAGIKSTEAGTAKTQAEIPGVAAESQIKQGVAGAVAPIQGGTTPSTGKPVVAPGSTNAIGPLGWNGNPNNLNDTSPLGPNDKIAIWKEQLAKTTNPEDRAALEKMIKLESLKPGANAPSAQTPGAVQPGARPTLQVPAGSNMSISAGGVNITPSAAVTGGQAAAASEEAKGREQGKVVTQYGLTDLSASLAKRSSDAIKAGEASPTGSMQELITRRVGTGEAERMRSDINRYIDGRLAFATASGLPAPNRDTEVQRIMQMSPTAFQNEMLAFDSQVARLQAREKAFSDYIREKGTATGFDDSEIKNKVYMYNPTTGQRGLASPKKIESLKKQGYRELHELNR